MAVAQSSSVKVQWGEVAQRFAEAMREAAVNMIAVTAPFDRAAREAFIADGGDPEEIRRIERAFGV